MNLFESLHGQLCWGAEWEHQLGFSLSFGTPVLRVREPYSAEYPSSRLRRNASYRRVRVRGEWWLWALCGGWTLSLRDAAPASAASEPDDIEEALGLLSGQRLAGSEVDPNTARTRLLFDLGAVVDLADSVCDEGEIWTLYKPDGQVVTFHTNGSFSVEENTFPGT